MNNKAAKKTYLMRYEPAKHEGVSNWRNEEFVYHIETAASVEGKEVGGRLAVRLGSGLLTDVVGVSAEGGSSAAERQQLARRFRIRKK